MQEWLQLELQLTLTMLEDIAHTLSLASRDGNYTIKDEVKLINLAKEWNVETEG